MAGRPPIGETALTPAQRAARAREKRKAERLELQTAKRVLNEYEEAIRSGVQSGKLPAHIIEADKASKRAFKLKMWLLFDHVV